MENWRWRLEISVSDDELGTADLSAGQWTAVTVCAISGKGSQDCVGKLWARYMTER